MNLSEIPEERQASIISPSSLFGVNSAKISPIVSKTTAQIKICDNINVTPQRYSYFRSSVLKFQSFERAKLIEEKTDFCSLYSFPKTDRVSAEQKF